MRDKFRSGDVLRGIPSQTPSSKIDDSRRRSAAVPQRLGFSLVNPPLGEALTGNALEHVGRALAVIDAQRHPALEDREEAFNRVRSHVAASVFLLAVIDRLVGRGVLADVVVDARRVGMQAGFLRHVLAHDLGDRFDLGRLGIEPAGLSAARDQRDDGALEGRAVLRAIGLRVAADGLLMRGLLAE